MEFLFILIVCIILIMIEYNRCSLLKNKVRHSKSSIDIYLNQRFDLIPNLVETTKACANFEKETIEKIVSIRNEYLKNKNRNLKESSYYNREFNNFLGTIEDTPELKSTQNFLNLQKTLIKIESQLQAARRIYNGDVTLYNTKITTFPGNLIANIFDFKEEELFEIDEYKKQNPKI